VRALRGVPVYAPAFAGIYCAVYPQRDGQAELTWVDIDIRQSVADFAVAEPLLLTYGHHIESKF